MPARVITIDGPAGVGKTTLAKKIAAHAGAAYLDTGAMFRGLAWYLGDGAWDWDESMLMKALEGLEFELQGSGENTQVVLNGEVLGEKIRTEDVARWASNMAKLPAVREALKRSQQELGKDNSMVAEGRDMGTVVFPGAQHKFFLEASPLVRAERRYSQLREMGYGEDPHEIARALAERDEQDRNREVSPLRPAGDAVLIDTGDKDVEEVFRAILSRME